MDLQLNGRTALVTGGSGGLGGAVAACLAEEGMAVVVSGRDREALARTAAALPGGRGHVAAADLSTLDGAAECVAAAVEAVGGLDLLVNCAGATKRGDFFDLADQDWADGFALKFHGTVRMCREAWPHLVRARGAIVNVVGVGSRTPSADFLIGGSVNSALLNFTKGLAERGLEEGVRVNAVNPGFFATARTEKRIKGLMAGGLSRDAAEAEALRSLGIKRFGRPEEVGRLVTYLASPQADYFQGATLDLDGGVTRGL